MTAAATNQKVCPECNAPITVHPDFVSWCEQCNWNLQPIKSEHKANAIEKIYLALGKKQSSVLFERFAKQESLQSKLTIGKIIAFLIATIVFGLMGALIVLGVILVLSRTFIVPLISIPLGLACFGLVWLMRPRFSKPPQNILTQEDAPTLYKVVSKIAKELNADVPEIAVDGKFNASMGKYTWRQREIMTIGFSLWVILTHEERVALLGHELAHSANNDPFRSIYIRIAFDALITWYWLVKPAAIYDPATGFWGILYMPFVLFMYLLAGIAWLGAFALIHLLWRDKQRAEYLADNLASSVSGTEAVTTMLKKLPVSHSLAMALQRFVLNKRWREGSLFEFLKEQAVSVPETEIKRLVRLEQQEGSRLDVTHPPIALRIKMLQEQRYIETPQIGISPEEWAQVEDELGAIEGKVQEKLVDWFRASRGF